MALDNLSKHGIITGSFVIMFFSVIAIIAANYLHNYTGVDQVFPPVYSVQNGVYSVSQQIISESFYGPLVILLISLVMIASTGLMIYGIMKERLLFIALWLIVFGFGILSAFIFFIRRLMYGTDEFLLKILCFMGVQILIFSPIAFIFNGIVCKYNSQKFYKLNIEDKKLQP